MCFRDVTPEGNQSKGREYRDMYGGVYVFDLDGIYFENEQAAGIRLSHDHFAELLRLYQRFLEGKQHD